MPSCSKASRAGAARGRYSAIGLAPDLVWRCRGGRAEVNRHALSAPHAFVPEDGDALDSLRRLIGAARMPVPPGLPPMAAGLFGYLGYDMVRLIERLPDTNPDVLGIPDAVLTRPTLMAVFDHVRDTLTLCAPVWPGGEPGAALEAAEARLDEAEAALDRPVPRAAPPAVLPKLAQPDSNFTEATFIAAVERAKEYIRAGDVFQVVPSQRFSVPFALPPFSLYRALRRINPAPFLVFGDFGGFSVVAASPEILVRCRDNTVTVRPLAGTRRRGATPEEDRALEVELLADPKERAEHLMLLDLGRNDVGRVAAIGSVKVTAQFQVERYSPGDAYRLGGAGAAARRARCARCLLRRLPGRHADRRAEDPRHGDHRGAGAVPAWPLCRRHRVFRRRWRHGYLHRAAHRAGEGRHHACPGRRGRRRRFRPEVGIRGDASRRRARCSAPPRKRCASPPAGVSAATADIAALLALIEEARASGRATEAAAALRNLAGLVPGNTTVRAALARALFQAGLWNEAWDAYEVRFEILPAAFPRVTRPGPDGPVPMPIWRGAGQPGAVLVMGEQGLGDTIQFARYLPLLVARGVRVHAVLDPRLHRLLAPLAEGLDLRSSTQAGSVPGVTAWLPLLNLPRALGLTPQQYGGRIPYLAADRERRARMRARIGDQGLRIGIVWQGNPAAPVDANRSAPLAAFAPIAAIPGVRMFSLQKGPGEEQQAAFPLDRLGPELDGGPDWFLDTAAAIEALDLVVTVDTAVLHLAGALGRPALMLAHGQHADWRWLNAADVPVWYPSVRLVRCPDRTADWAAAAARAAFLIRSGNLPAPVR